MADFERSRQAVLAGTATQAESNPIPSEALTALTVPIAPEALPVSAAESVALDAAMPLLEDIFGSGTSSFEPFSIQRSPEDGEGASAESAEPGGREAKNEDYQAIRIDPETVYETIHSIDLSMGEAELLPQSVSSLLNIEEPVDVEWIAYLSSATGTEVTASYEEVFIPTEATCETTSIDSRNSSLEPAQLETALSESSAVTLDEFTRHQFVLDEAAISREMPAFEQLDALESDANRSDVPGSDALESDVNKSDALESDVPENLTAAVQAIAQIFDRLPTIQSAEDGASKRVPPQPAQHNSLQTQSSQIQTHQSSAIAPKQSADLQQAIGNDISHNQPQSRLQQGEAVITPNLTVRVTSERLERMNNLVGELAINRDGLSLQNEQLRNALKELLNRFTQFRGTVGHLRELSDQMLVEPERHNSQRASVSAVQTDTPAAARFPSRSFNSAFPDMSVTSALAEFDPLEMDSYGALHTQIQEILENIAQLEETVDDVTLFAGQSNQILDQQRNMLAQLRDELIWARMFPLGEVINRFPRMIRDLSITYRKPVALKLSGAGVLVDKAILEKLFDPLLHLLRNAFDHGIEPANVRRQRGKPEQGQIEIRAYHKGNQTIIQVRDDGQGLDLNRIRSRAIALGWLTPEQAATVNPAQLYELIFEPGFSTARRVTELSGRGVGLDVVRSQLRSIKGTVNVVSAPGRGTIFTLQLPLTLTIAKLVICLVDSTAVALPADSIEEILTPQSGQVQQSGTQRYLNWREQIIPTYRLTDLLSYSCPLPENPPIKALSTISLPKDWALPMLVLRQDQQIFALEVDRLVTEQELVIKPFGPAIAPPSYAYGCTILGDGSLVPVIDGAALLALSMSQHTEVSVPPMVTAYESMPAIQSQTTSAKKPPAIKTAQAPTVLIIDDSATLRRTAALSLERAGFRVLAVQGRTRRL
ncbi:MAG: chemotaxis protein CheA, partial [Leptolyngbyaceae cyanobacterium RM1_405_57]|nr:chemotaxis protein CheA [Leptolyngbyaceae cyanobacterium RM1_405_57]